MNLVDPKYSGHNVCYSTFQSGSCARSRRRFWWSYPSSRLPRLPGWSWTARAPLVIQLPCNRWNGPWSSRRPTWSSLSVPDSAPKAAPPSSCPAACKQCQNHIEDHGHAITAVHAHADGSALRNLSARCKTLLRRWINVIDVDSTSQQRRVPGGFWSTSCFQGAYKTSRIFYFG